MRLTPRVWRRADRTMYAVHPIPLSEIKAIRKTVPTIGWHYICVVLVNGLTLPPLYFNNGGVRAFLAALKQVSIPPPPPFPPFQGQTAQCSSFAMRRGL